MKKTIIMSLFFSMFAMLGLCAGGRISPIENGKLVTDLNGNSKKVVGLTSVQVGTHTINQEFLDSIINGSSVETLTFQNVTGIVDHAISLIPPCPAEVDAAALAALASLTNQARIWIDAPGATRWATVEGGMVVTLEGFRKWMRMDTMTDIPLPYPLSETALTSGWEIIKSSGVLQIWYQKPGWGVEAYDDYGTEFTLIFGFEGYPNFSIQYVTTNIVVSTSPAPIAPIPPYILTFTGLTNWVAYQTTFEAALISGITVNREAFDVATNTLAIAAEDAYTRSSTAITYLNSHTDNGTIAADKHLLTGDRGLIDSVPGKVNAKGGTITNSTLVGTVTFGGESRTSWPSGGTAGAITNGQTGVSLGTITAFGQSSIAYDASRGQPSGTLALKSLSDGNQRLNMGFEFNLGGFIQSISLGSGYFPLLLQPSGGNVLIGTSTGTGERLQVEGDAKVSGDLTVGTSLNLIPTTVPTIPIEGQIYHNTTDHHTYSYDGTEWKQLDVIPSVLSFTNAIGVTTAQVWSVGGAVSTNFFSASSSTWTRPSYWPVGAGYTLESWLTPENKKIKMVIKCDGIEAIRGISAQPLGFIDWYGDGTCVSNFASHAGPNTTNYFVYPPEDIGKYIPVVITVTNSVAISLYNYREYNPIIGYGDRFVGMVEYIAPSNIFLNVRDSVEPIHVVMNREAKGTFNNCNIAKFDNLEDVGTGFMGSTYALMNIWGEGAVTLNLTNSPVYIGYAFFNSSPGIVNVSLPNVTNTYLGQSPFASNIRLTKISLPKMQTIRCNSFCKNMPNLSDIGTMPDLSKVGTDSFSGCNIGFAVMTNFALSLAVDVSKSPQVIDFRTNPGSAEFGEWYRNASPIIGSNQVTAGWSFLY